jgi:hypothetical protein
MMPPACPPPVVLSSRPVVPSPPVTVTVTGPILSGFPGTPVAGAFPEIRTVAFWSPEAVAHW